MKIGELSKHSGLNPSRIRFYEARGLLNAVSRRANGYRDYPREAVFVLSIITRAQQAGFSLEEIRSLLPTNLTNWKHGEIIGVLRRKIADIETMQRRLRRSKSDLQAVIQYIEERPAGIDCAGNTKRVLEGLRNEDGAFAAPLIPQGR
jgi:DNA-binding transcriptional MerR regulator